MITKLWNTEYNELVKKVRAIQTTDTSNLVKNTDYNAKINEIERKIWNNIMHFKKKIGVQFISTPLVIEQNNYITRL